MALVGIPNHRGSTLILEGIDGVGDNAIVAELDDIQRFDQFAVQCAAGAVDVEASLDGVTFSAPLALEDKHDASGATTRQLVTSGNDIFYFFGNYKALRVRQAGATAATGVVLMCGKTGRRQG